MALDGHWPYEAGMMTADANAVEQVVRDVLDTRSGFMTTTTWTYLSRLIASAGGLNEAALARLMMAHAGHGDQPLKDACAQAIAACNDWRTLLAELLSDVEPNAAVEVATKVLTRRKSDHALVRLPPPSAVLPAFDLTGRETRLRMPKPRLPVEWRGGLLLGVDRPTEDTAVVTTVDVEDNWLSLELDGLHDWMEPNRVVCPGCLLILT